MVCVSVCVCSVTTQYDLITWPYEVLLSGKVWIQSEVLFDDWSKPCFLSLLPPRYAVSALRVDLHWELDEKMSELKSTDPAFPCSTDSIRSSQTERVQWKDRWIWNMGQCWKLLLPQFFLWTMEQKSQKKALWALKLASSKTFVYCETHWTFHEQQNSSLGSLMASPWSWSRKGENTMDLLFS